MQVLFYPEIFSQKENYKDQNHLIIFFRIRALAGNPLQFY